MVTWCCTPFLFSGHPNNASLVMVMLFIFIKNILIRSVRGSFASVNTSWVGCIIGFDPEPETRKPEPCPYIFYPAFSWDVAHKQADFSLSLSLLTCLFCCWSHCIPSSSEFCHHLYHCSSFITYRFGPERHYFHQDPHSHLDLIPSLFLLDRSKVFRQRI